MPYTSPHHLLNIPKTNILSYTFPTTRPLSQKPIWLDAANPSSSLSQTQALIWIKRLAVGLDKMGVEPGRVIMTFSPNHIYMPIAYLGSAGSKRRFTGANPVYTANEVTHQMSNTEAAIVLIHPSLLDTGIAAAKQAGIPTERLFQFSDTEMRPRNGVRDWRTMLASEAESKDWTWDSLDGEPATQTIAVINFSSGTTGLPKGVCITHHNLIANSAQAICNKFVHTNETEDNFGPERWVASLPLYHAYSQLWTINIALRLRIEVYVMSSFVFRDFLEYLSKYKITGLQVVPPMIIMLAKRPETKDYDLSSIKHIMSGAAPLSRELQNEVSERFKLNIAQGWGMSETTCAGIIVPPTENDQTGSIGYLLPNTEAKLVDEEGNEVTTEGEPGELWLRGPQMMLAYWRNDEATNNTMTPDRWLKTGDVAVTKGGKWWIVDRKKELIKVNGLQVAPAELEAVLLEHEGIADAAATGIILHGEELPIAYVVLQDPAKDKVTTRDVQDFVMGKVARHKQLKGGVKFVDAIPKLASGKIIRKLLKEWAKRDQKEMEGKVKARL